MKKTFRYGLLLPLIVLIVACSNKNVSSSYSTSSLKTSISNHSSIQSTNDSRDSGATSTSKNDFSSSSSSRSSSSHQHTFSSLWSKDDTYHWHDATCGHNVTDEKEKHIFGDWQYSYNGPSYFAYQAKRVCTKCGYTEIADKIPENLSYNYILTGDGRGYSFSCNIPYYYVNLNPTITVPSSYNGKPIIRIESYAFYMLPASSITLPDTIESIGDYAFAGCAQLTKINIPNGVKEIGKYAFSYTTKLTTITIPDSVTSIGQQAFEYSTIKSISVGNGLEFVADGAFADCSKLTFNKYKDCYYLGNDVNKYVVLFKVNNKDLNTYQIHSECRVIYCYAFSNCKKLTTLIIPDKVIQLCNASFDHCYHLTQITIGAGVRYLGGIQLEDEEQMSLGNVFSEHYKLFEVINKSSLPIKIQTTTRYGAVSRYAKQIISNESLSKIKVSDDGFITYEDEGESILIGYHGNQENITIPSYVTSVADYGLWQLKTIKSVVIPENVKSIGDKAFSYCTSLENLTFSEGIKYIGDDITYGCSNLKIINRPANMDNVDYIYLENSESFIETTYESSTYLGTIEKPYLVLKDGKIDTLNKHAIHPDCRKIMENAFYAKIETLTTNEIIIPEGVVKVENFALFLARWTKEESADIYLNIPHSLTRIEGTAFAFLNDFHVHIPKETVEMSASAFSSCSKAHLIIDDDNPKYKCVDDVIYDKKMTTIILCLQQKTGTYDMPNSVKNIGDGAFACTQLSSIKFSNNLSSIGWGTFTESGINLESLTFPSSLQFINAETFMYSKIKEIDLSNCENLELEGATFHLAEKLETIKLPHNLKKLPNSTFHYCQSLKTLDIPESVEIIESVAIFHCDALKNISIPKNVSFIGQNNFRGCTSLDEISVANDNSTFSSYDGALYDKGLKNLIACPQNKESIVLPDSIENFKAYAFSGCSKLTNISIPSTMNEIPENCFAGCQALKSIEIPDSVAVIGLRAFSNCSSLETIKMSRSIVALRMNCFSSCNKLSSVIIPYSIKSYEAAFYGCKNLTIYSEANEDITNSIGGVLAVLVYSGIKPTGEYEKKYWHYVDNVPTPWN